MNGKHTFPNLSNTVSFPRTHREALGEPLEDPERRACLSRTSEHVCPRVLGDVWRHGGYRDWDWHWRVCAAGIQSAEARGAADTGPCTGRTHNRGAQPSSALGPRLGSAAMGTSRLWRMPVAELVSRQEQRGREARKTP